MKRFLPFVLFGLALVAAVPAQTDLQPAAIVRLTKTEPITVKQLRTEVERMETQARRKFSPAERRQILDVMINERLAIQAAERDKITVTDNEVNQQIQQLRDQLRQSLGRAPTDAEFTRAIADETGLELNALRDQIRRQGIIQRYLVSKKQDILQSVKAPTEAEIVDFFNNNKTQFVRPDTVRLSMILVPYGQDRTKARALADQLIREIGSSASRFDEAVLKAQAPDSGYQGGDAGYLPRNDQAQQRVGQDLLRAAFNLKQGEVSSLVESPQGYNILKITETLEMKPLGLDDMAQPGTRVTVKRYIEDYLSQQRQQEVLARAQQELVTELRTGNPFQVFEANLNW
ncbi:MAG: peptidyl-prolyl cis-trans isomerase [Spirochaetaceae bacterium]|jgi:parvulin-like peptidyl-prolyl isomerase|nr:peptidyl-prolyl cis-trans isomerase [Spirochaetaceae bacterium]